MKEVLPVWGVLVTCSDGRQLYARHSTCLAAWFDREQAVKFAAELQPHLDPYGKTKVIRLTVTVEPSPVKQKAKVLA